MKAIPVRWQLSAIGITYASIFAFGAALVIQRHIMYVQHPEETAAAGGMYGFGDILLGVFLFGLCMVPTLFLVRVIAHYERSASVYAKALLAVSLSAPVCLGVVYLGRKLGANDLADVCLWRLLLSPFVLVALTMSRVFAKFGTMKRLVNYAVLVELGTFAVVVLLIVFARESAGL